VILEKALKLLSTNADLN